MHPCMVVCLILLYECILGLAIGIQPLVGFEPVVELYFINKL